jgi:predicted HTH transcriptional regulator
LKTENPIKLMERRGSGLRKIIDEYPADVMPVFRSTEQSFVVTLKNLNYGKVSMPSGVDVGIENGIDDGVEKNTERILNAIFVNSKITQKEIASETGLSVRTVARELKHLRDTGVIKRIGSDRSGYWEIVK